MRITEQIKHAINADTYISGLLPVKNGRALCPFHGEKTPSFRVHKDYFKCFGCGAGGDVITFAAKYHQISVGSAIRMLARDAGVNLSHQERPRLYDEAKAQRLRAEAVEWRRTTRWAMVTADNYETSIPFIEDLDAMTEQELLDAYMEQRTPEQAAALRESARQHAIPTLESLVMEFLKWSR